MAPSRRDSSPDPIRRRSVAIACLLVAMTLSTPVLAAGAAFAPGSDGGSDAAAVGVVGGADGSEGEDNETIEIADSLESADGTVEVVVQLEETTVSDDVDDPEGHLEEHAEATQEPLLDYAARTTGVSVETEFWLTNAVLLTVDTDRVDLGEFDRFAAVEAVHENFEVTVPEQSLSNATALEATTDGDGTGDGTGDGEQSSASGDDGPRPTAGLELVNAPAVWDAYDTRGEGVRVAVLDTGIDTSHPDLELYTDDPSDPTRPGGWAEFRADGTRVEGSTPYDSGVHGTHVSGTIAGSASSGERIGVAPEAELLHGLVLHETSGSFAQIIAGMEWALAADADVINLSLGSAGTHDALIDPVRNARNSGVVVVAAVGNEGVGTANSPATVHDAISVGAVDEHGDVASFSGGRSVDRSEWQAPPQSWPASYAVPDLVAPGVRVTSAVPGGYAAMPGTSMAAPHVSGVVALLSAIEPSATPGEIEDALYGTAWKPAGAASTSPDVRYGHGIVDAEAAADALVSSDRRSVSASGGADDSSDDGTLSGIGPLLAGVAIVVAVAVWALFSARSLAREEQ